MVRPIRQPLEGAKKLLGLFFLTTALLVCTAGECSSGSGNAGSTTNHGGRTKTLTIPDGDSEITTDMAGNWHPKHGKGCTWWIKVKSGRKTVTMASGHGGHATIFTGYKGGIFHSSGCGGWH